MTQLYKKNGAVFIPAGITVEEVEKLKDDNKVMADNYSKMEQKFYDDFTKAKELLKTFLLLADNKISQMEFQLCVADAKQFLNSKVEK